MTLGAAASILMSACTAAGASIDITQLGIEIHGRMLAGVAKLCCYLQHSSMMPSKQVSNTVAHWECVSFTADFDVLCKLLCSTDWSGTIRQQLYLHLDIA